MFYLLRPNHTFGWVDFLRKDMITDGVDLDRIEWDDAERKFDVITLRFALRRGYAVREGLAFDAMDIAELIHLQQLMEAAQARRMRLNDLPSTDLMEALSPGWKAHNDDLDEKIDATMQQQMEEVGREVLGQLNDVPPKDELVQHWTSIGGRLPREV